MKNLSGCTAAHGQESAYTLLDTLDAHKGFTAHLLTGNVPYGRSWETEVKKVVGYGKSTMIRVMSNGVSETILTGTVLHNVTRERDLIDWAKAALNRERSNNPNVTHLVVVVT
jgi:hypothetical protein